MQDDPKPLLKRIKDHWLYAIIFVAVMSAGGTYATVRTLIIGVLYDHIGRQAQEIADLKATQASRAGAPSVPAHPLDARAVYRTYEWQWSGENWYGRLTLANHDGKHVVSSLRIGDLRKKYTADGQFSFDIGARLVELTGGSFELDAARRLKLDITVDKTVVRSTTPARQKITGSLDPRLCFAGRVDYADFAGRKSHSGDMILVDYISRLDGKVEDFFPPESRR